MVSSLSGDDEPNPAPRLATQTVKLVLSCLLDTACCVPQEKYSRKSRNNLNDKACSVKMAQYWRSFHIASLQPVMVNIYKAFILPHSEYCICSSLSWAIIWPF